MNANTRADRLDVLATATEDDLMVPVNRHRERLVTAATEGQSADELATIVEAITRAEAVARLRYSVGRMLANGSNTNEIEAYLTDRLIAGADDTFSGRGNDLKRAAFDAVRDEVRDLLYPIRRRGGGWRWTA